MQNINRDYPELLNLIKNNFPKIILDKCRYQVFTKTLYHDYDTDRLDFYTKITTLYIYNYIKNYCISIQTSEHAYNTFISGESKTINVKYNINTIPIITRLK